MNRYDNRSYDDHDNALSYVCRGNCLQIISVFRVKTFLLATVEIRYEPSDIKDESYMNSGEDEETSDVTDSEEEDEEISNVKI